MVAPVGVEPQHQILIFRNRIIHSLLHSGFGAGQADKLVVPGEGLEPTRPCGHQILSLTRLPIPPSRQAVITDVSAAAKLRADFANNYNLSDKRCSSAYTKAEVDFTLV